MLFVPSHLVALMTLGVSTGLVLDLGYKEATLMPIYEGVVVFQAWQALPLGGRLIERHVLFVFLIFFIIRKPFNTPKRKVCDNSSTSRH